MANIVTIYAETRAAVKETYSEKQLRAIDSAIDTITHITSDEIEIIANPNLSETRMELVTRGVRDWFELEWCKEIADTKLTDQEAEIVFNYYSLKNDLRRKMFTNTQCKNTDNVPTTNVDSAQ